MEWYEKFKVGQKVRVVRKTPRWNYGSLTAWNDDMDRTVGKTYMILCIDKSIGFMLSTGKWEDGYNYWYPLESFTYNKGEQLLFNFME